MNAPNNTLDIVFGCTLIGLAGVVTAEFVAMVFLVGYTFGKFIVVPVLGWLWG